MSIILLTCYRDKFVDGEKISLFYDVIETCLNNEQRIIIDIKERRTEVVQIVLDAYRRYPMLFQKAVVSSFNPIIVYMVGGRYRKRLCLILDRSSNGFFIAD